MRLPRRAPRAPRKRRQNYWGHRESIETEIVGWASAQRGVNY